MRLNRYIATYSGLSRRKADALIAEGKVAVNRRVGHVGMEVTPKDSVVVDGKKLIPHSRKSVTVLLHKPLGYVCSSNGQGAPTVYDLLPRSYENLNIAGRLDKDSSGLVILTDDGSLLQELTHPSFNKKKTYEVTLSKKLTKQDYTHVHEGVSIGDERPSRLAIRHTGGRSYVVTLTEGRNRQIRRTFEALGYAVEHLHRIQMGRFQLGTLRSEQYKELSVKKPKTEA